jgi:iron complex transport system ATP-binding protein
VNQLLRATGVSFAYGERQVLRAVDVTLASAEVVSLIGPNGSGKSTLIKSLLGHLHATGTIEWDGKDLKHWRRKELARVVAYLPQAPAADAEQRVADVLRTGRAPYWGAFGIESERDVEVVGEVAQLLSLNDLLDRQMQELSGGQRQMVFIGRCLAQEPRALLLDEPNTYLDLKHQVELLRALKNLARERKIAVLMASHDLNLAAAFSDRLVLLEKGAIAAHGAAREVLRADLLSRVYEVSVQISDGRVFPVV